MTPPGTKSPSPEKTGAAWDKPLPVPDALSAHYWEGARRHELVILKCTTCGTYIHPPRAACRACQRRDLVPTVVPARGEVYSFTITHVPFVPGYEDDTPFVLVLVALDVQPGVRIPTILRDCPIDSARIGMRVTLVFDDVTPDVSLPFAIPDVEADKNG
jgi:uncharacterized protein